MKTQKIVILSIAIVVVGGILVFSTWNQWNDNQKTTHEEQNHIAPIAEFNQGDQVHAIAFSPTNPDLVASVSADYTIKVWNRNNPTVPEMTMTDPNQSDIVSGDTYSFHFLAFYPTGERLVSRYSWTLDLWDLTTGKAIKSIDIRSGTSAISPANHLLATASMDVKLWDISDLNEIRGILVLPPIKGGEVLSHEEANLPDPHNAYNKRTTKHRNEIINQHYRFVDFSRDGKWIVASGEMYDKINKIGRDQIKIWDLHSKQLFKIIEGEVPDDFKPNYAYRDIRSIKFSPDNRFFAVVGENKLTIWSLPEWNIYYELLHEHLHDVAFSPNGKMYAVADLKSVTLWSLESMTPIASPKGKEFSSKVNTMRFSQDGSMLAGGGYDGILWLWDVSKVNEN